MASGWLTKLPACQPALHGRWRLAEPENHVGAVRERADLEISKGPTYPNT